MLSDDDLPLTQVLLAFSHLRLEGWCWSQELQVILFVPVVMMVTQWVYRRGLVREVAPNVVDATAVELPSSPHASVVDAFEFDLSVPAFDPMESDEEDEFDAGVPTVPVSSGSVREAHGFRRLVLVSNTVDVTFSRG